MLRKLCLAAALFGAAIPAAALESSSDADGDLNPQQLTVDYWIRKLDEKPFDKKICWMGFPAARMLGKHAQVRRIFEACAEAGVTGAMPWMSFLDENGFDKLSDPEAAAAWDKKLADTGSSLGAFNYGLDLLRGRGVRADPVAGRALIDRAARDGDVSARDLAASGYDPESVTPSADADRYRKFGY